MMIAAAEGLIGKPEGEPDAVWVGVSVGDSVDVGVGVEGIVVWLLPEFSELISKALADTTIIAKATSRKTNNPRRRIYRKH